MKAAIVDTRIGNFGSIAGALRRAGAEPFLASSTSDIRDASHIVLPGVGSFDAAIDVLDRTGLRDTLSRRVVEDGIPTLGICLGMHVLGSASEEGSRPGLGWLKGRTVRFRPPGEPRRFRVPHIGWNRIAATRPSPLLDGLGEDATFYYVHSYHYLDAEESDTLAVTDYDYVFPAIVHHRNLVGTQFHPERSGATGIRLIANFLRMRPGD